MNTHIRQTAVAGSFYPGNADELTAMVDGYLSSTIDSSSQPVPKAIIAPHAGYIYSGPVAASVYQHLLPVRDRIHRVVLLGPSHRVAFHGLAVCSANEYATPLGNVPLDTTTTQQLCHYPQVIQLDQAHEFEHSLEVQLPFLQRCLDQFMLLPIVVGDASPAEVSEVLEALWGDEQTLIVISSDLSHYHSYTQAQQQDRQTSDAIEALAYERIGYDDACGRNPLTGLLQLARTKGLQVKTLDLRNSGDTAGPRDRVVGYGAYICY